MFIRDEAQSAAHRGKAHRGRHTLPSGHDRARHRHRNPDGWAFGAVRAILSNPTCTGYRVWGKQQKVESLIDPDDVAAGNRTFMRWRDRGDWARSTEPTHEPLVTEEVFEAAQSSAPSRNTTPVQWRSSTST
jgi:hypothetical protein